tara:strand:+ start:68 stop:778 length:711 start_codon:yes stop_codon:yes gene_type:complete
MNIYYIGDSWNEFPKLIEDKIGYLQFHGAGLEKVWNKSAGKRQNADITIFTIPGMVRSIQFMYGGEMGVHRNTHHWCSEFYNAFKDNPKFLDEFLEYYFGLLTSYYEEQQNLVYFIYSTGGWPYRHPYNMKYHGIDDFEERMLQWWKDSGMRYTYLDLTGQKGMCKKEIDVDDDDVREMMAEKYYYEELDWKLPPVYSDIDIFPPNGAVLDHHPSLQADEIAAEHIKKYIKDEFNA